MAMDIDPFSMLEVSLQEDPEPDDRRHGSSASVMHQVENDVEIVQPPPPFQYVGNDVLTPQRAVLNNIQKLALISKEEEKFRRRAYSSISLVLRKRLHCTICDAHIGAYLGLKDMDIEHPLLKVLACSKCTLKYHYLEFPLNPDGRDIRCRWCTESAKEDSPLRFCSYCPFAFCEMCIYRNLPLDELASNKSNWICFVCNVKDLWPTRAVLWALRVLIDTNFALKEERKWSTDQSTCCKNKSIKQRRPVVLPPSVVQPSQNGHNQPPPLRPIAPAPSPNNFRTIIKNPIRHVAPQRVVRPILPIAPTRALPMSSQTTQLYDTAWLTEKVQSISTTLLNLNNNLHRIAQGIPEKENKYSIKSKMISMVSLLNISATQLQKASKEMEEESKKILDKNYKVAKVSPVPVPSATGLATTIIDQPMKIEHKVVLKPIVIDSTTPRKMQSRKRSVSSSSRNKRFKNNSSEFDSEFEEEEEEDFNDPDFLAKTRAHGEGPRTRLKTRECFVKLERLDEKIVVDLEPELGYESPRPSTSRDPDPLGTVGPDELRSMSEGKENGECTAEGAEVREPESNISNSVGDATDRPHAVSSTEAVDEPRPPDGPRTDADGSSQAADDSSRPGADGSSQAADDASCPGGEESVAAEDSQPGGNEESQSAGNKPASTDIKPVPPAASDEPRAFGHSQNSDLKTHSPESTPNDAVCSPKPSGKSIDDQDADDSQNLKDLKSRSPQFTTNDSVSNPKPSGKSIDDRDADDSQIPADLKTRSPEFNPFDLICSSEPSGKSLDDRDADDSQDPTGLKTQSPESNLEDSVPSPKDCTEPTGDLKTQSPESTPYNSISSPKPSGKSIDDRDADDSQDPAGLKTRSPESTPDDSIPSPKDCTEPTDDRDAANDDSSATDSSITDSSTSADTSDS